MMSIAAQTRSKAFPAVLERLADSRSKAPAVSWKEGATLRTLSWSEYRELVLTTASGFLELGVPEGGSVAILAGNRVEHLAADLASAHCRAAATSIYPTFSDEQLAHVLSDLEPDLVVVESATQIERIHAVPWIRKRQPPVVLLDPEPEQASTSHVSWSDLQSRGAAARAVQDEVIEARIAATTREDPLLYIYTSGTTGAPKGVILTHGNLEYQAEGIARTGMLDFDYSCVSYLPLAHIAERLWSIYVPLHQGGHVLCCPDPAALVEHMREHRPTLFFAVPRIWEKLRDGANAIIASKPLAAHRAALEDERAELLRRWAHKQQGKNTTSVGYESAIQASRSRTVTKIKTMVGLDQAEITASGAAPISQELCAFFASLGLEINQGYGLTETGGISTCDPLDGGRAGAVGVPLPGCEIRIAPDGEILIKSPGNTPGYRNRPDETSELFDADGYLRTGDIGFIDEARYLHITDRKKDLIINAAGKNIAPTSIELLLQGQSFIDHVAAFGEARPYVVALLTVNLWALQAFAEEQEIAAKDPAELITHPLVTRHVQALVEKANQALSRPEQIKYFELIPTAWSVETGELTPTQKLRRKVIEQRYADVIEVLYAAAVPNRQEEA